MSVVTIRGLKGIPSSLDQVTIPSGHDLRIDGILDINYTGAIQLPTGNTAARPATPAVGYMRFNTDSTVVEYYNGTAWIDLI
jgi:hypothetical protein